MRSSRSSATFGGSSPPCTASCRADNVWERKSVGARSLCPAGSSIPSLARRRTIPQSTTNLVMGRPRYLTHSRDEDVLEELARAPAGTAVDVPAKPFLEIQAGARQDLRIEVAPVVHDDQHRRAAPQRLLRVEQGREQLGRGAGNR